MLAIITSDKHQRMHKTWAWIFLSKWNIVELLVRNWTSTIQKHSEICPNQWELRQMTDWSSTRKDSKIGRILMVSQSWLYASSLCYAQTFKTRICFCTGETPAYHYGTHYSSAMIVASYLVRMEPFTQIFLRLQVGSWPVFCIVFLPFLFFFVIFFYSWESYEEI